MDAYVFLCFQHNCNLFIITICNSTQLYFLDCQKIAINNTHMDKGSLDVLIFWGHKRGPKAKEFKNHSTNDAKLSVAKHNKVHFSPTCCSLLSMCECGGQRKIISTSSSLEYCLSLLLSKNTTDCVTYKEKKFSFRSLVLETEKSKDVTAASGEAFQLLHNTAEGITYEETKGACQFESLFFLL